MFSSRGGVSQECVLVSCNGCTGLLGRGPAAGPRFALCACTAFALATSCAQSVLFFFLSLWDLYAKCFQPILPHPTAFFL